MIETFLPALCQKYLFANFEQSSMNRKYKDCIPEYLHNRPKAVVLHCLDRKASSARFTAADVIITDSSKGVFEVKSGDNTYEVDFQTPLCTCHDWTLRHYPCKHMFAVFHFYPSWDWNHLPKAYLNSPQLSLDTQALDNYFGTSMTVDITQDPSLEVALSCDQTLEDEDEGDNSMHFSSSIPTTKVKTILHVLSIFTCSVFFHPLL